MRAALPKWPLPMRLSKSATFICTTAATRRSAGFRWISLDHQDNTDRASKDPLDFCSALLCDTNRRGADDMLTSG